MNARIVVIASFVCTTWVYLESFEFFILCCYCSLVRLIMLDLFKHYFISLVLGITVLDMWGILIGSEMLIDIPKSAIIQFYPLVSLLIIVFENLRS